MYSDKILISYRQGVFEIVAMHYPKFSFWLVIKVLQGDVVDPDETIMVLSIPTTEIPTGHELVSESARDLPQQFIVCVSCVWLRAFFPVLLATDTEHLTRQHS